VNLKKIVLKTVNPLKIFFRMSSFGLLSGDPSKLEGMFIEMCIKREINDAETGSKAYYESMIYLNNQSRERVLQDMEIDDDDLIASSKDFLENMRDAIKQQNNFIEKFAIQPDPDEQNHLKIVSKGWYNLLRRQLMRHRNILAIALNQAAGDRLRKISGLIRQNCRIERRIERDSNERYPPVRN